MDQKRSLASGHKAAFGAEIERFPDGIANCFLITFTGEIVVSAVPAIFDSIRPDVSDGELNVIADYGSASLYANLNDLEATYRHFHDNGIRVFRSVIIDADPGRPLFQNFSRAVAESVGLQPEFRNVRNREDAFRAMRAMIGAAAPPLPSRTVPGRDRPFDKRHLAERLGRRFDAITPATDLEFDPGGIPNSFLLHMNAGCTPEELRRIFAALQPHVADHRLNVICDERQASPDLPQADMRGLYTGLAAMGVYRYTLVVISERPERADELRASQEIARDCGIDAAFFVETFAELAVARLREQLADRGIGGDPPDSARV